RNVYDAAYAPIVPTMCLSGYLPPSTAVPLPPTVRSKIETCDAPTIMRWWVEMFRLTGEPRYLDAVEREVYNQLLAHRSRSGHEFAYMPSQHFDSPSGCVRRYGCLEPFDCCWSMGPVGFGDLPRWCYFTSPEGVLVNFYEPSSFRGTINGVVVKLEQKTKYPLEGRVKITVNPERPVTFALQFRIPDWVVAADVRRRTSLGQRGLAPPHVGGYAAVMINGKVWGEAPKPGTILSMNREWRPSDRVTLELPMPARVSCPMESAP